MGKQADSAIIMMSGELAWSNPVCAVDLIRENVFWSFRRAFGREREPEATETKMDSYNSKSRGEHGRQMGQRLRQAMSLAALVTVLAGVASADRTPLRPGWNMFSPEQDIQLGRDVSRQAEQQLRMLNDPRVDNYLNHLGEKLSTHAPGYSYPYQYKCVNDSAINAFALPGGFVYINRGAIEAADNEAQLAGVLAHETSHVALRHGTNQATKANAWQVPLGLLGALAGENSIGGLLTQMGASFTLNSILLKNSRTDETQADVMGTQILYDSGYDPRAMAQFFEKIEAESKGHGTVLFFSDHPNPGNRRERVDEEVDRLGGPEPNYKTDSQEFKSIKRYLLGLPRPPKAAE